MHVEYFEIPERFRGPPRSGNGGYTCGRIARHLGSTVAVRLKAAPPLHIELRLESGDDEAHLFRDSTLIGEARRTQLDLQPPPSPAYEQAEEATRLFRWFKSHRFPGCFVCGPERQQDDGLRLFPGPIEGTSTIAAPWAPNATLADQAGDIKAEFLWSALDCTGAFTLFPLPDGVSIVLGELAASIAGTVKAGDQCIVIGWPLGGEGRKHLAGTAIYAPHGRLVATARATWFEVPSSAWN